MHEWSLVQSLVESVARHAQAHRATAVRRVHVRVGEFSGVEPDLLAFAFEAARPGTLCDGAELVVDRVPAAWVCTGCGRTIPNGELLECGECGAPARLEGGDELFLDSIEMEVPDV